MKKAVIFDFNGTLFFDTEKHIYAWQQYATKLLGRPLTNEEFDNLMGRTNAGFFEYFLGRTPTDEEVMTMGGEKEEIYRKTCRDEGFLDLAPGANEFLDMLKEHNIPIAIATSSDYANVEFYFSDLNIGRWFDENQVTYNDGKLESKPAPDIYLKAAAKLGVDPSDCIVFEDAVSGVAAAYNAGVGKIYAVASATPKEILEAQPGVDAVISDYTEVLDIDMLLK